MSEHSVDFDWDFKLCLSGWHHFSMRGLSGLVVVRSTQTQIHRHTLALGGWGGGDAQSCCLLEKEDCVWECVL